MVIASSRGKESAWEPQVPPPQAPSTSKAGRSGIQALLPSPTLLPGLIFFPFKVNLQTGSRFVHGHPSQLFNVFRFSVEPWEISRKAGMPSANHHVIWSCLVFLLPFQLEAVLLNSSANSIYSIFRRCLRIEQPKPTSVPSLGTACHHAWGPGEQLWSSKIK